MYEITLAHTLLATNHSWEYLLNFLCSELFCTSLIHFILSMPVSYIRKIIISEMENIFLHKHWHYFWQQIHRQEIIVNINFRVPMIIVIHWLIYVILQLAIYRARHMYYVHSSRHFVFCTERFYPYPFGITILRVGPLLWLMRQPWRIWVN